MHDDPLGVWVDVGARRFRYAECYYFGNPGGYQFYLLACNDVSSIGEGDIIQLTASGLWTHASGLLSALADEVAPRPLDLNTAAVRAYRSSTKANTLVIVRADRDNLIDKQPFGPDTDHVRVLPEASA